MRRFRRTESWKIGVNHRWNLRKDVLILLFVHWKVFSCRASGSGFTGRWEMCTGGLDMEPATLRRAYCALITLVPAVLITLIRHGE